MAVIDLRFHDIPTHFKGKDATVNGTLSLLSNQKGDGVVIVKEDTSGIFLEGDNGKINNYGFHILKIGFTKQIYEPTAISVDIEVYPSEEGNEDSAWSPIMRDTLEEVFKDKRVSLQSMADDNTNDKEKKLIGSYYYVSEIKPHYKKDSMYFTLIIYSPDKLMTKNQDSKTFVAKKLCAGILAEELKNYTLPWDKSQSIKWKNNMKILAYKGGEEGKMTEHIFPYLVQYNESFHDMLIRTANRWGEFLYFEDGCLNVGYDETLTAEDRTDWTELNYEDIDDGLEVEVASKFAAEAAYDDNTIKSTVTKDPTQIKGQILCDLDNGLDSWIMKQFPKYFGNTKSVPTLIGNVIFDNLFDRAVAERNKLYLDDEFNGKYFTGNMPKEQYGFASEPKKLNLFSELDSKYDEKKYRKILLNELLASKNAIRLDYGTNYPDLKLGQRIKVYGNYYIVIRVLCITKDKPLGVNKHDEVIIKDETPKLNFEVLATLMNEEKDDNGKVIKMFYPTILHSGHIRPSGPQLGTVTDAEDPANENRVRIMYPAWQDIEKDEDGNITDKTKEISSPWIVYATSSASQGNGIFGRHYEGDQVIVNFAHGNVERPYIVGGLSTKGNKPPGALHERDIVLTSPGNHALRIEDGSGAGLTAFLAGLVFPGYDMLTTIFPQLSGGDIFSNLEFVKKNSKNFEGGFQLTDKYGIYNISGSTDGRNVSIKSPWGDVGINAFTGISISAPNGDISIKGKNVTIQAGNNLELISGANVSRKLAESKDTWQGDVATFAADVAVAVAKKFAEKFTLLDMGFLRSVVEVTIYPVEGALTVKSNRYLKLEAGKGSCDYPAAAYKDQATIDKMRNEQEEENLRPGLELSEGMVKLITKVKDISNSIDKDYRKKYNACVDAYSGDGGLTWYITRFRPFANGYRTNHDVAYTKDPAEILSGIWADPTHEITENDIFTTDKFKADSVNDIEPEFLTRWLNANQDSLAGMNPGEKNEECLKSRRRKRETIKDAANRLREKIQNLTELTNKELTRLEMTKKMGSFGTTVMPTGYKDAMTGAFKKDNLGDTMYRNAVPENLRTLSAKLNRATTLKQRQALGRKAAILLLTNLGFKEDWRLKKIKVANPYYDANNPGLAPQEIEVDVEKKFDEADVTRQNYWPRYVQSIVSVPKLTPIEAAKVKAKEALKDVGKDMIDFENLKFLKNPKAANWSWGEAKQGGILFNYMGNTYSLKNDIEKIEGASKENLTTADDDAMHQEVNGFLQALRTALLTL